MGTQREEIMEKEMGSQMQLFVYRNPKKNHDAMVQLQNEFKDMFRKLGDSPRYEVFYLDTTDIQMEGVTNIVNTVSANQDDEVWVEILSYKDRKHMDKYCEKCNNDQSMVDSNQKFMNLVTPGTGLIMGDFSRTKV